MLPILFHEPVWEAALAITQLKSRERTRKKIKVNGSGMSELGGGGGGRRIFMTVGEACMAIF